MQIKKTLRNSAYDEPVNKSAVVCVDYTGDVMLIVRTLIEVFNSVRETRRPRRWP